MRRWTELAERWHRCHAVARRARLGRAVQVDSRRQLGVSFSRSCEFARGRSRGVRHTCRERAGRAGRVHHFVQCLVCKKYWGRQCDSSRPERTRCAELYRGERYGAGGVRRRCGGRARVPESRNRLAAPGAVRTRFGRAMSVARRAGRCLRTPTSGPGFRQLRGSPQQQRRCRSGPNLPWVAAVEAARLSPRTTGRPEDPPSECGGT